MLNEAKDLMLGYQLCAIRIFLASLLVGSFFLLRNNANNSERADLSRPFANTL